MERRIPPKGIQRRRASTAAVLEDADGQLSLKTVATIVKDDQDRFHDKCPMK